MSNYFKSNLKWLRKKHEMDQIELAEMLGYKSSSGVSEWEKGIRIPESGLIADIARIFNVSMDDLMKVDLSTYTPKLEYKELPVLGPIAAGTPILADNNISRYFKIDKSISADFIITVKGDSMIDEGILDGDLAFIRHQDIVENGEIAAVLIDDCATLKKFYRNDGTITLIAANKNVPPKTYTNGDIRIMGKLVAVLNLRK